MSAAARRRRTLAAAVAAGVLAALITLLLTSGGGGGGGGSAPIADRAVRLVPASALVWVHLSTDGDRDAVRRARDLAGRFPSYARLQRSLLDRLSVRGAAVSSWLGDEAGLALLDSSSGTASSLVVLGVRDADAAKAFVEKGVPQASYRGVAIRSYGSVSAALTGGFVVLGAPDVLHRAIDLAQGRGDALAGTSAYQRAMNGPPALPASRVADAYVTSGGVRRVLAPAGGVLGAAGTLLDRPGLKAAALSLAAEDPGLRIQVHTLSEGGGKAAFPPFTPELTDEVPSGVLAYIGVRGFDQALGRLLGVAGANVGQVLSRVRPLLAPLKGEVALFATSKAPAPILTVIAAAPDASAVEASLAKLGGRRSQVAGVPVTTVRAGAFELDAATFDGRLVLSTSPQGIAAVRKRHGSLAGDDAFRATVGAAQGPLTSMVFLDFDQLLRLGEQTGLNDSRAYQAVRQDLRQVRAVGARSSGGGGDTTAEIRISLR